METKLHFSSRGIWIFIDGKHKKTVPLKYKDIIEFYIHKLDFNKKYLSKKETELLQLHEFNVLLEAFLTELKKNEPKVYQLINKANQIGVRYVNSKIANRYELCFDNHIKIKIPKKLYTASPVQIDEVFLNY